MHAQIDINLNSSCTASEVLQRGGDAWCWGGGGGHSNAGGMGVKDGGEQSSYLNFHPQSIAGVSAKGIHTTLTPTRRLLHGQTERDSPTAKKQTVAR
jgi:hypothetical protein